MNKHLIAGAVALAVAFWASGLLNTAFGEMAATVALAKVSGGPLVWLVKGALCNALVCLAVWLSVSARDTTGKIFAILWPVTAFVTLRLEHSVANMFFLPLERLMRLRRIFLTRYSSWRSLCQSANRMTCW